MRSLALLLAVVSFVPGAQARPAPSAMSCAAARGLVESQGAVVMDTGSATFDRIVRDGSFCPGSILRPLTTRTRDRPDCIVGYVCEPRLPATGG